MRRLLVSAGACADAAEAAHPPSLPAAAIARLRRMASLRCESYDGDTDFDTRADIRKAATGAHVVFTNVDMVHAGLLPNHATWPSRFWQNLTHVVLDEAHVYTGVFGSHCALVFRRLRRLAASYGASPQFLCSSATMAEPGAHVARLTGVEAAAVAASGAPCGAKALLLWQPPELEPPPGQAAAAAEAQPGAPTRKSVYQEAGEVVAELLASGLRVLCFVSARKLAEIVANNARIALRERGLHIAAAAVESYRGGYAPHERRELEQRLITGVSLAVVSTSALELGIDVGELDGTVHVGVPETAAAQWQQAGRAGRRQGASLAVFVTAERPLDAYFLSTPALLAARAPEPAHLDTANAALLQLHLPAAAHERSLVAADAPLFGGDAAFRAALAQLQQPAEHPRRGVNDGAPVIVRPLVQYEAATSSFCCLLERPSSCVAIRGGLSRDVFQLHDGRTMDARGGGRPCEESLVESVEARYAMSKLHVGAIFRHRMDTFEVMALDLGARIARGRLMPDTSLQTAARERVAVREVRCDAQRAAGAATACLGRLHVSSRVTGYVKTDLRSGKQLEEKEFPHPGLPGMDLVTDGVWWIVPREVADRLASSGKLLPALNGARNLAAALLPSFCACEAGDVGACAVLPSPNDVDGCGGDVDVALKIYVYDCFGGVGLCAKAYGELEELWRRALAVLERCGCATGCASCTQATRQGAAAGDAKQECRTVLQGLLGAWMQDGAGSGSAEM